MVLVFDAATGEVEFRGDEPAAQTLRSPPVQEAYPVAMVMPQYRTSRATVTMPPDLYDRDLDVWLATQ